jgi:hypothetical protein
MFAFFAGLIAFVYFRLTSQQIQLDFVGQNALLLMSAAQRGLNAMGYLYGSAEYSLDQSFYELAKNGGYVESSCGRFYRANVWAEIKKEKGKIVINECYPSVKSLADSFNAYFNKEISGYATKYPLGFIPSDYNYELSEESGVTKIIVKSDEYIEADIGSLIDADLGDEQGDFSADGKHQADINSVKPEVMKSYNELCRLMGEVPSGVCTTPFKKCCITSGYRNDAGMHGKGLAIDIYIGDLQEQLKWAESAEKVGFTGIGVYPCDKDNHLHLDLRKKGMTSYSGNKVVFGNGKMFFTAKGRKALYCKGPTIKELRNCAFGVSCYG